jgi:hypothetical protein
MKKYLLPLLLVGLLLYGCDKKKDYSCTLAAGTVVTNPDGSQYTVTDTDTKSCTDCTDKDVDNLKKQGYTCK